MTMPEWSILDSETDGPMLRFSRENPLSVDLNRWHVNFMRDLLEYYNIGDGIALDIGASYGWFTIPFAKQFDHVYAFEANPNVFECHKNNLKQLNINNVTSNNFGLSDHTGTAYLNIFKNATGVGFITDEATGWDDYSFVKCELRTLDSFEITNIDFIKIDVEGYESKVISGGMETISLSKPKVIVIEIESERDRENRNKRMIVLESLYKLGYKLHDVRKKDWIFVLPGGVQ